MPTGKLGEKFSGRTTDLSFTNEEVEVTYYIHGSPDEDDAKAVLIASAPSTWPGQKGTLIRKKYAATETNSSRGSFTGVVTYNLPDFGPKDTGETVFTFDTTGGTQHIIHGKGNVARYPSGTGTGSAPDLGGMINVSASDIGGCDITIPAFAFTSTKYFAASAVDTTFINKLYNLTGKTNNNAPWTPTIDGITLSFLEGEALHLGATGSRRGIGDVEISQHFAGSQNATNLTVANFTGISKRGWEYLWVMTDNQVTGTGSNTRVVTMPTYVYIEKVYDETDFSATGL